MVKSSNFNNIVKSPIEFFVLHFATWQILNVTIFLLSRQRDNFQPIFSNQVYLGLISLSTLAIFIHLFFLLIHEPNKIYNINLFLIFSLPSIFLYLSMFLNHDFRSMQSLTLFLILVCPILFLQKKIVNLELLIKFITLISVGNFIYSFLQFIQLIPVAQLNEREIFSESYQRPTGIFFNAFAMSYASLIFLAIGIYFYKKHFKNKIIIFSLLISSFLSLLLSGTRTSLWLGFLFFVFSIIYKYTNQSKDIIKMTFWFLVIFGSLSPFFLIILGIKTGNAELATLNGRTQMWICVLNKSSQLFPIGIGLDNAFPPQYCAETGWFSNLRHPENMFLLSFVESGILGFTSYIVLFIYSLKISYRKLLKNNYLPLFLTITFLLASLIYVPLFHYLPFLPKRPADRGIFNFHLLYIIWIYFLVNDYSLNLKKINKIRK